MAMRNTLILSRLGLRNISFLLGEFVIILLVLLVMIGQSWGAKDKPLGVNCSKGQTIADALNKSDGQPIMIEVLGTCTENIEIVQDGVTLFSSGGTINAADPNQNTITVKGNRTVINGLRVIGGWNGIKVEGEATIKNTTVQNAGNNGMLFAGYKGKVDDCEINNNFNNGIVIQSGGVTITGSRILSHINGTGINVSLSGSARIGLNDDNEYSGNTITGNESGVVISFGASAFLGGNTISNNGQNGLTIRAASALLAGKNRLTANGGVGMYVWGSHVEVSRSSLGLADTNEFAEIISDNIGTPPNDAGIIVTDSSSMQVRGAMDISNNAGGGLTVLRKSFVRFRDPGLATISNNTLRVDGGGGFGVRVMYGGGIIFQNPQMSITGNAQYGIACNDQESSVASFNPIVMTGNAAGNVQSTCTGF